MAQVTVAPAPVLESVLTCPECGHAKLERMPTDVCQFFYECGQCKTVLRPKACDCCVFCSYGSVKCPPVQAQRDCSSSGSDTCTRAERELTRRSG
jgi:hypothetical protein